MGRIDQYILFLIDFANMSASRVIGRMIGMG